MMLAHSEVVVDIVFLHVTLQIGLLTKAVVAKGALKKDDDERKKFD